MAHVREKNFTTGVLALYDPTSWEGPSILEVAGARVAVIDAPTPLVIRQAISFPMQGVDFTVLVTPLLDADLPDDILAHLTPFHRVNIPIPADALRELFSASTQRRGIIRNRRDIAGVVEYLARCDGDPVDLTPASTGVLTAAHLHHQLLTVGVGLPTTPNMSSVIAWSLDPASVSRWADFVNSVSPEVRESAVEWLRTRLGEGSGALVRYLNAHGPRDLAAWGLVAEVVRPGPGIDNAARAGAEAAFRITTGTGPPSDLELEAWANASISVFSSNQRSTAQFDEWRKLAAGRAEEFITAESKLGARNLLYRSQVCRGALSARIAKLTEALSAWYADPQEIGIADALASVQSHASSSTKHPDIAVAMALIRMINWLRTPAVSTPSTLSDWLKYYRRDISWLDVCINRAWGNQSTSELARLSHRVLDEVRPRRNTLDREFAAVAANTAAERHTAGSVLLAEDVLDRVVAPLLEDPSNPRPVLMIVLDGMSIPAANILVDNILSNPNEDWQEAIPDEEELSTALSVLPSVTTFARTSLISGKLNTGGQASERAGLEAWASAHLKNQSTGWSLQHKADLDAGIVDSIRVQVEDTERNKLVVAVLNTIDDALDKSDPIERVWDVQDITHLHPLLQSAAAVGRTVLFVSDHGHVLERHDTSPTPGGTGTARWREPLSPPQEGETLISGSRVLSASGEAILAVDEGIRYTSRKAGYHGGLSLSEVATPVTILTNSVSTLANRLSNFPLTTGSSDTRYPEWWNRRQDNERPVTPTPVKKRKKPVDESPALFDTPDIDTLRSELLPDLERNTLFRAQTTSFPVDGRSRKQIAELIRKIATNSGRLPISTLRETWQLGPIQLRGVISTLLRILNIDGVQVLEQQDSDLVLNRNLLAEQFDVKDV
ncbi:BREX-2 system phosphatase PglZ [Corynebacterium alimapuense]|uniref:BREX-2 system phosphatase PglZ n=1 Tax=Corynebacterium alimapuense TaxID=1576874 RepID=UPI001FEBCD47|nr:BREX-2 system phosphatase PglZ [Corynebacterium alimapuense]